MVGAQSTLHLNPVLTALQQNVSSNEMKHSHTIQVKPASGNKVEGQYDNKTPNVSDMRDNDEEWVGFTYPQIPCSHGTSYTWSLFFSQVLILMLDVFILPS